MVSFSQHNLAACVSNELISGSLLRYSCRKYCEPVVLTLGYLSPIHHLHGVVGASSLAARRTRGKLAAGEGALLCRDVRNEDNISPVPHES